MKSWNASSPQMCSSVSHTGGIDNRSARNMLQSWASVRYSNHSSKLALSLIFGVSNSLPGSGGVRPRLKALTALRFVRIVLISPLWHVNRNGCASFQFGKVFVL